ncbi:MAG: L,D-transpeptidase family protein, partial [Methyloceanibacter sp.]
EISELCDQTLPLDDPDKVLAEIEAADAPDAYLRSLHPKHEGFARLRQALVQARAKSEEGPKPENAEKPEIAERDMRRLILNLERWRWLPDDLGATYIWLNTPEFTLYVFKDGKEIYSDKTLVGTIGHATPVFSADLATIVFNPEWIAPESVREETIQPQLRSKNYDFFRKYRFSVRYRDRPVNVARVDWRRVDIDDFTFIQKPGPGNNLGKVKFLYPNEHDVYMHDTLPLRKKAFKEAGRDIGNGCVRMERPDKFAELLLAEDKQWPASRVKALWDKSVNEAVTIDGEFPVHTVYFTAVAGENSKVATFADVYGLDRKLATAMFGDDKGFPEPPPEKKRKQLPTSSPSRWSPDRGGVAGALDSFLD